MNNPEFCHFDTPQELNTQLTQYVTETLKQAIAQRGYALLCVSGGSTPVPFFRLLSQQELDWQKVSITLADERWVPADHPDSNQKLVMDNLLINNAANANFIGLFNDAVSASEGETHCNDLFGQIGKFDIVILGMGQDGHTASLFPQAKRLDEGTNMNSGMHALAIDPVTAPHDRMSLTLPRLLNTRQIVVHITGAEKRQLLIQAQTVNDKAQWPIAFVLQQNLQPVSIYCTND